MEVRLRSGVRQGKVSQTACLAQDDGTDPDIEGAFACQDGGKIELQRYMKPILTPMDPERQGPHGCLLPHAPSIILESIDVPVPCR